MPEAGLQSLILFSKMTHQAVVSECAGLSSQGGRPSAGGWGRSLVTFTLAYISRVSYVFSVVFLLPSTRFYVAIVVHLVYTYLTRIQFE